MAKDKKLVKNITSRDERFGTVVYRRCARSTVM